MENEIEVNGKTYVLKSTIKETMAPKTNGMEYAIIAAREDERNQAIAAIARSAEQAAPAIMWNIGAVLTSEKALGLIKEAEQRGAVKLYESIKSKFTNAGLTEKEMNENDFRRGQSSILENMESELRRKGWIM